MIPKKEVEALVKTNKECINLILREIEKKEGVTRSKAEILHYAQGVLIGMRSSHDAFEKVYLAKREGDE